MYQKHDKLVWNTVPHFHNFVSKIVRFHYLLPEKRHYSMLLRPRGHNYTLNHITTTHFKNTFVNRCIFGTV